MFMRPGKRELFLRQKNKCVVHYYLRSSSGHSLLAAVGTEKSRGCMLYAVSEEFLEAFVSYPYINAYTKWTTRRDIVKWLISLVRKVDPPYKKSDFRLVSNQKGNCSNVKKKEKLVQEDPIKLFPKKLRSCRVPQRHEGGRSVATNLVPSSEPANLQLNIDLSGNGKTGLQPVEQPSNQHGFFKVGDKIEILCQDSGMRGCWFRCKIVKVSKMCLKVQYNDVKDVEGSGKLEEWVPASRIAAPDKLSMRHSGRLTIRPYPPEEVSNHSFEVGAAVDAWWCHGWWESIVVTGASLSSNDDYHVFLPGDGRFLTLHRDNIRASRDWADNTWVAIKPHPDVLSVICSSLK